MAADSNPFLKMVPGFDFLQGLVKNAGSALPNMGQWVAPTLDPDELAKEIEKLRTVQFWLEQNARMVGTTIQALEVQRMTLSTLKTMNVSVGELREAMTLKPAAAPKAAPAKPAEKPAPKAADKPQAEEAAPAAGAAAKPPLGAVDPMQWWGALTQQFTQLATQAMKDGSADTARNLAQDMVKQSISAASDTFKKAAAMPAAVAQQAADMAAAAAKTSKPARKATAAAAPKAAAPAAKKATRRSTS